MERWTSELCRLNLRPPRYGGASTPFWDDDYVSRRLLEAHLDPDVDAASRRPEAIDATVEWLASWLERGSRVLDLGCGPGLYDQRLARRGFRVTGVDLSRRSLAYARERAREEGLDIDYRLQDYRELDVGEDHDAALIIYGDLGALSDRDRDAVLDNILRAVRPGGWLVFDVMTEKSHRAHPFLKDWYFSPGGFWRPGPHFVLQQGYEYEEGVFLQRLVVLEQDTAPVIYDLWDHTYSPRSITEVLTARGFVEVEVLSDLAGTPYREGTEWLGVRCRTPMR